MPERIVRKPSGCAHRASIVGILKRSPSVVSLVARAYWIGEEGTGLTFGHKDCEPWHAVRGGWREGNARPNDSCRERRG